MSRQDAPDILRRIAEAKRREVEWAKKEVPLTELEAWLAAAPPPLNLAGALMGDGVCIIAEVKRASPTKGGAFASWYRRTLSTSRARFALK